MAGGGGVVGGGGLAAVSGTSRSGLKGVEGIGVLIASAVVVVGADISGPTSAGGLGR